MPDALDYMKEVLDKHAKNGISYQGFYSDEMHIQFDWDLTEHFGPTEIQTRYVTDSLIDTFAARYGERFRDFAGHVVYFLYTKHEDGQFHNHMMGPDAAGAYDTVLFRKRYFEMLSERVVGLSMDAKAYAESIFEKPIMTRAHATWQESPRATISPRISRFRSKTVEKSADTITTSPMCGARPFAKINPPAATISAGTNT